MRRPLRAVATAAVALACVAGCSAEPGDAAGDAGKADKAGAAERTAAPVPSEIRLAGALATRTDVRGYRLEDNDQPAVRPKADREECRALADMTGSGVERTPMAKAWSSRSYGSTTERGLAVTTSLFSYEGDGAATTLADLREALDDCADGFSTSGNNGGATVEYVAVRAEEVPSGGDEAVAWSMTGRAQGQKVPLRMTAVRQGNVVALFLALHLTEPEKGELPRDLYDAQLRRLKQTLGD
ncbi:hypothetical protein [Streptomyces cavernicola]|uniref:Sensor domain-containing protein n=1 Tax=Streptomyces cavernicola TaxID=3043613 RepID=A0ABT6SC96_9ACTN|nr:hypothetical protein [Streptomyces sp. B-S-A6]MDI3405424.1 hypothetical protein [Streptomyces sp. B-S-A6]